MQHQHFLTIDSKSCIKCGLCIKDCVINNLHMGKDSAVAIKNTCLACGHCVAICPQNAVGLSDFEDSPLPVLPSSAFTGSDLVQLIRQRRSIRQFQNRKVPQELLKQLLTAGQYTPTASNSQNVSYLVIRENIASYEQPALSTLRRLKRIQSIFSHSWDNFSIDEHFLFKKAPLVMIIKSPDLVNASLAAASIELTANAFGLGVLYSGFFSLAVKHSRKLQKKLLLSSRNEAVLALAVGHPAVKYKRTAQKEHPVVSYD